MSIEIMNKMLMDFALFSSVDSLIILSYVLVDRKIKISVIKFISLIFGLTLVNVILCEIVPQLVFQFVMIIYTALVITYITKSKIKHNLISVFKIMMIMLILQILSSLILNYIFNIDLFGIEVSFRLFILLIPSRICNFILIYIKHRNGK